MTGQTKFRCAIYTRKSSEEGLDQDFNSIEAQREAGEAYVRSQAHEGWTMIPERYDDGGFSGGNTDRPALSRLMDAVRAGQIDIVVIYKIDRLTRSLTDFARLAETFDQHNASFVSVTQQFNTTNSMGRLMLNVLLSFAQFEREITGERIRDKIAASKKKGMWMGGPVPMGYAIKERRLIVDEGEAKIIRSIFRRYIEVGTVPALVDRLEADGVVTAARTSGKARATGNRPFTRGHLYKLLCNAIYVGRVHHKGATHPGQHEAIVDLPTWTAVQAMLSNNTQGARTRRSRALLHSHLLADLLHAADGRRFTPSHTNKGARQYRYYVESATGGKKPRRLPAAEIEHATMAGLGLYLRDRQQLVLDLGEGHLAIEQMLDSGQRIASELIGGANGEARGLVRRILARVIYRETGMELHIRRPCLQSVLGAKDSLRGDRSGNYQSDDDVVVIQVPVTTRRRGPQLKLSLQAAGITRSPDRTLLTELVRARDWAARIANGASVTEISKQEGITDSQVSRRLPLAFLAPTIVESILVGRQPGDLVAHQLINKLTIPLSWVGQQDMVDR